MKILGTIDLAHFSKQDYDTGKKWLRDQLKNLRKVPGLNFGTRFQLCFSSCLIIFNPVKAILSCILSLSKT